MTTIRATVTCPDCDHEETFESLGAARQWIDDHERETGHDPVWELGELASGVERAGASAGVCGIPGSDGKFGNENGSDSRDEFGSP